MIISQVLYRHRTSYPVTLIKKVQYLKASAFFSIAANNMFPIQTKPSKHTERYEYANLYAPEHTKVNTNFHIGGLVENNYDICYISMVHCINHEIQRHAGEATEKNPFKSSQWIQNRFLAGFSGNI